jgi:hypothetical protein
MDFQDIYVQLRDNGMLDCIDKIEDFRDALQRKSYQMGEVHAKEEVVKVIAKDSELIDLAKDIPNHGNLRKVVLNLAIQEFLRH